MHLTSVDLPGTVVAEQGENLAAVGVDADALQRMDRAEALLRMAHGKDRRGRRVAHCILAA